MKAITKLSILLIFVAFNAIALGQNKLKPVDDFVNKLQQKGIDTILIYKNGCSDCMVEVNRPNCHCLDSLVINEIYIIYQTQGKAYKINFSCCNEDDIASITNCKSIRYFLSLKQTFASKNAFYKEPEKIKNLPVSIPDDPFEEVELIVNQKHLEYTLNFNQRNEGYKVWKKYFWIDEELKLTELIRRDLGLP